MFPARNRIIAALADMTVVVAARRGSGAMLTIAEAEVLGRRVGGVPGQVTAPLSWGPHLVVQRGGALVSGPDDVLDALGRERLAPASSRERIERAKQEWKDGKFGLIPGDDKEFIPLPEDKK